MDHRLFPTDLPEREWAEFDADGFSTPVAGAVYRGTNPPSCGMPLGGIDTGCLDLEPTGLLGYCTIFNSLVPRRGPMGVPFLGISVGRQTWVLTTLNMQGHGGAIWSDAYAKRRYNGVRTASEIDYWGHCSTA